MRSNTVFIHQFVFKNNKYAEVYDFSQCYSIWTEGSALYCRFPNGERVNLIEKDEQLAALRCFEVAKSCSLNLIREVLGIDTEEKDRIIRQKQADLIRGTHSLPDGYYVEEVKKL